MFYTQLFHHASRKLTPHQQPRVTMHTEPLAAYLDAIRTNDWHTVGRLLRRSADLLARCGAEFCVTPDNIVQHASHLAEAGSPLPWLSMTDLVADAVVRDGRRTVGVIGTKMVVSSAIYQTPLGMRGVHVLPPHDSEAERLDQIIFGELLYGHIRPESRQAILQTIANLADRGCEAVILACSEAPLVVTSENSPIPVYDATDLLAEGAIRRAMLVG